MNSVPLFAIFALFYGCDAALQVVTVSGRLICCRCEKTGNADVPAAQPTNPFEDGDGCCARLGRSLVEIIEKNIIREDKVLSKVWSDDSTETFTSSGSVDEFWSFSAVIQINHQCGMPIYKKCTYVTTVPIPQEYVNGPTYVLDPLDVAEYPTVEMC